MSVTQMPIGEVENPFGAVIDRDWLTKLENDTDFWNRTPQLQLIAWAAAQEKVSAWGLLLACLIHQLSYINPIVVLVKRDGTTGTVLSSGTSCNLFGALTAPTGGGKSAIFRAAGELIPPMCTAIGDGTGQGFLKTFAETKSVAKDPDTGKMLDEPYYVTQFFQHSVVVHAPEVDTLNSEMQRDGSKTAALMRSMWVGEIASSVAGDVTRRVTLPPNTYRFGGLWGVQPKRAMNLLAGADAGTPQRWVWAPSDEWRRINPPKRTQPSGTVEFRKPVWGNGGNNVYGVSNGELPTVIEKHTQLPAPVWVHWSPLMAKEIKDLQDERDRRKDRDPYVRLTAEQKTVEQKLEMESHLILTRIKLTAALAFLHGRCNPTDDDWELAGVQMQVSQRELAGAWMDAEAARLEELANTGTDRGLQMDAANDAQYAMADGYTRELAGIIWNRLAEKPRGITAVRDGMGKKQKNHYKDALELLECTGRAQRANDGRYWAFYKGSAIKPATEAVDFVPWGQTV